MRSLATLGGVLVIVVLAIAWRISNNNVEASNDTEEHVGIVTLGMKPDATDGSATGAGVESQSRGNSGASPTTPDSNSGANPGGNSTGPDAANPHQSGGEGATTPPANDENANAGNGLSGAERAGNPGSSATGGGTSTDSPGLDPAADAPEEGADSDANAASKDIRYTVQEGDTLYRILMKAYNKATPDLIEEIAVANNMDDPGAIHPGDELKLPKVEGYQDPIQP